MINEKKHTNIWIVVSGCFILGWILLNAVYYFFNGYFGIYDIDGVIVTIAYVVPILLPIGMLAKNKTLCVVGCLLGLVCFILHIFISRDVSELFHSRFSNLIKWDNIRLDLMVIFILGIVCCFSQSKISASICFACAVIMAIFFVAVLSRFSWLGVKSVLPVFLHDWELTLWYGLDSGRAFEALIPTSYLFGMIGYILCGIGIMKLPIVEVNHKNVISQVQPIVTNKIDRLISLKNLLDQGVISQEEFNKKKQEIINQ